MNKNDPNISINPTEQFYQSQAKWCHRQTFRMGLRVRCNWY